MMKKGILKVTILLIVLLLAAGYFGVHKLRTGPDLRSESLTIDALNEAVDILYDSMGVPHIFAGSLDDLFLAQGYVHARDRLWQMEMFRRVQEGRLSEIFGERMLETDRFLRTLGMAEAAKRGMPAPETRIHQYMTRYAEGVNAAIQGWEGTLPPEFVLLRIRPEPWEPYLTQGVEKIMAWDLADYQTGLRLAEARGILGDEKLAPLMPHYPDWGVTIVEGWPGEETPADEGTVETSVRSPTTGTDLRPSRRSAFPPTRVHAAALPPAPPGDLTARALLAENTVRILEMGSAVRASNSWVVGGDRSRSGKPLLANDMHLALNAPNIWYLVGLHAPGFDVVGMSLPGAPGVVAGHSRSVAWGFTNAMVDDSDFFIEEVDPQDSTVYRTPDGWAPFQIREEVILVRGGDPDTLLVRSTRHGPVITPVEDRAVNQLLSFRWVAHEPSGTFEALMGMGGARDVDEFLTAMRGFDNPHQNVVFADTSGAWGYWMGGHVPLRASDTPPHLPVPGWTGEHDWVGWVPFEEKPHVLAPERGYIATANNAQGRDVRARRVSDGGWFGPYRAQRISELIESRDLHDAGSMLAIQMDPGSAFVDRRIGQAVTAFQDAGFPDLARQLETWDRLADLESTEATLFHTWWRNVYLAARNHYYDGETGYFPAQFLEEFLEGTVEMPDGIDLPSNLLEDAARAAAEYDDLPWGEAHRLTLDHPMSVVPVLGALFRFGRSGIPRTGGPYSINVAGFGGSHPPFTTAYGPSQRHVIDMADPDGSGGFILPGGQSGYPSSPHSFDQLELWRAGRLWLLPLERNRVEQRSVATVRMEPAGS
jgi:penicillin amidase